MGSVITEIECPNCKSDDCQEDYNYQTGEFYINCVKCGYHHSKVLQRDEEGLLILKDKDKPRGLDNSIMNEEKIEKPYGAYLIQVQEGFGHGGVLHNEGDYNDFKAEMLEHEDRGKLEFVRISRFVDGKFKEVNIIENEKS